jgi:hypothetical protein
MALRRFGLALAAATLTAGCCWCHHHRYCYAAPPLCEPAAVPAAAIPASPAAPPARCEK